MKTKIAVTIIALAMTSPLSFSKEPAGRIVTIEQKVNHAKENLMVGLHSDNTGLVESSIRGIAEIKLQVPSANIEALLEALAKLSITHGSETVRYKAYLAASICTNPQWFSQDTTMISVNDETFYIAAANRLQEKLFGFNSF